MADTDDRSTPRRPGGWRVLGAFWAVTLSLMAGGGGVLQWLGPPNGALPPMPVAGSDAPVAPEAAKPGAAAHDTKGNSAPEHGGTHSPPPAIEPAAPAAKRAMAGRDTPGPIADPDPSLFEPSAGNPNRHLPRIGTDGRIPMRVYAAGFDQAARRPKAGILLAGIGMNETESDAAIRALPGAVSLVVSPYAINPNRLLTAARAAGHEFLIALPLEPTGFPLNDPGPATLLTSAPVAANLQQLHWSLTRIDGYVGAAGVIGTMRGERLAAMTDQMDAVLSELAARGLLYIDPREERGPVRKTWGRHADLTIDDPGGRDAIDAKLAELEQQAKDHGTALGLVLRPSPVAVARVAAWINGLADRGVTLAPVTALAGAPSDGPVKVSERDH